MLAFAAGWVWCLMWQGPNRQPNIKLGSSLRFRFKKYYVHRITANWSDGEADQLVVDLVRDQLGKTYKSRYKVPKQDYSQVRDGDTQTDIKELWTDA